MRTFACSRFRAAYTECAVPEYQHQVSLRLSRIHEPARTMSSLLRFVFSQIFSAVQQLLVWYCKSRQLDEQKVPNYAPSVFCWTHYCHSDLIRARYLGEAVSVCTSKRGL